MIKKVFNYLWSQNRIQKEKIAAIMSGKQVHPKAEEVEEKEEEKSSKNEEAGVDALANSLKAGLALADDEGASKGAEKEAVETPPVDEVLRDIVAAIKSGGVRNIVTMVGAGISTSAGIPDFRSPDIGIYNDPEVEDLFYLDSFKRNPEPFFRFARKVFPGAAKPTPSHRFVKLLQQKKLLLRHYTQNIDALEHDAGLDAALVIEAHGTVRTATCLKCQTKFSQAFVQEHVTEGKVPKCDQCKGVVKPDIVFFGENLPTRFFTLLPDDMEKCDLMIVMGTSLTVQPFASIADMVGPTCPRLLINRDSVGFGTTLSGKKKSKRRDTQLLGDCDAKIWQLTDLLGWRADLEKLIEDAA